MGIGSRLESIIMATYRRDPIDPQDAGLVADYYEAAAQGYIEVKRLDSDQSHDTPIYNVSASLTSAGENAVREILARNDAKESTR